MKFEREFLVDELDLPGSAKEDKVVETSRWSTFHEIVFYHEGKYYQTGYSVGSTEYQDERPWEDQNEVDCTEVELREVLVKQWVPVEE